MSDFVAEDESELMKSSMPQQLDRHTKEELPTQNTGRPGAKSPKQIQNQD